MGGSLKGWSAALSALEANLDTAHAVATAAPTYLVDDITASVVLIVHRS
jgi:hypothetical protein